MDKNLFLNMLGLLVNVHYLMKNYLHTNLYCLNENNTRGEAGLDNILINRLRDSTDCQVIEPYLSDHSGVLAVRF